MVLHKIMAILIKLKVKSKLLSLPSYTYITGIVIVQVKPTMYTDIAMYLPIVEKKQINNPKQAV